LHLIGLAMLFCSIAKGSWIGEEVVAWLVLLVGDKASLGACCVPVI